jgi:hypothetical protein
VLSDEPLLPWGRNRWRKLACAAFIFEIVPIIDVFVPHPEENVGISECFRYIESNDVPCLIDIAKRRNNFLCCSGKDVASSGQICVAPTRRIFLAVAEFMRVMDRDFRPVWNS